MAEQNKKWKAWLLMGVFVSSMVVISPAAHAQVPCDETISQQQMADKAATMNAESQRLLALNTAMQNAKGSPVRAGNCLDGLLGMSLSLMMGLPSWDSIIQSLINAALNAACNAARQQINTVMGPLNNMLSYPGIPGVPGTAVNLGLSTNGPGGVVVNNQQAGGFGNFNGALSAAANQQLTSFNNAVNNTATTVNNTAGAAGNALGGTSTVKQSSVLDSAKDILKKVF